MTKEDEETFLKIDLCRFCERYIVSDKVRQHCHLMVDIEVRHITNVIKTLNRNKLILFHLHFTISPTMTAIYSSKNLLIRKKI